MVHIKPLGKRVLVKRSKAKEQKGSIILPDSAQEKPKEGTIVAVGPGGIDDSGKTIPLSVKEGERVVFGSYAGTEVKEIDSEDYLILSEDEILGVLQ